MLRKIIAVFAACLAAVSPLRAPAQADEAAVLDVAVLTQGVEPRPALSNLVLPPPDSGLLGARLAIADNNTTGRFMKQRFEVHEAVIEWNGDAVAAFRRLAARGYRFFVVNVSADALLAIADLPEARDVLIFNAGAPDDRLRIDDCRPNVLHTVPSRAMSTDALAQYLAWKRWRNWFLVAGRRPGDRRYAEAVKRAARRFGARIVAEKSWDYGPDARRTAQAEVPVFTQEVDYDVLFVADEVGEFGEYLMYRTWTPRLVVGTQGLVATTWTPVHEQWGAAQLQSRFVKAYGRSMNGLDYTVWLAVRALGEGATRSRSTAFEAVAAYLGDERFGLAGFKGQKLTFRRWNGQLRQPVLLATPTSIVSVSPQPAFLHERSYLDTLGYDEPESNCRLAAQAPAWQR